MAFRSLEALQRLFASNPEFKNAIEAVARDGFSIMTMPQQVAGHVARTYGKGIEGIADIAGDVAGFAADVGPRLEVGRGDAEIDIPLPITAHARAAEGVAGLVEKGGEALSKFKMPAESFLDAMDRRLDEPAQSSDEAITPAQRASIDKTLAEMDKFNEGPETEPEASFPDWEDLSPEEQQAHQDRWGPRNERGERIPEEGEEDADTLVPVGPERDKWAKRQKRKARKQGRREAREAEGEVDVSGAARAVPVVPDDQALDLFATVHGGPFDPNSSMDRGKLATIKENLVRDEYKGLTPNQFALKMYREAA